MLFVIGGQQEISSAGVIQVRLPFAGLGAAERHSPAQHAPARHDAACVCHLFVSLPRPGQNMH